MKLRHFAALALVGWYLIAPPLPTPDEAKTLMKEWASLPPDVQSDMKQAHEAAMRFDLTAPLSQWSIIESFDTGAGCETELTRIQATILKESVNPRTEGAFYGQCIATDDPRLKKK